jgi:hypothetical protein
MIPLKRRQLLLGTLIAGVTATTLQEWGRLRRLRHSEEVISDLLFQSPKYVSESLEKALTGDTEALKRIKDLEDSLKRVSPTVPYNRAMSKRLIQCCRLGTEQYLYGKFDPKYDGSIAQLPITSATLENAKMNRPRVGWAKRSVPITQLWARWARFALPILRIKSLCAMHPI